MFNIKPINDQFYTVTSSWKCPLTDVTQWMSRTETLSTHLGILPEAVTSALCCSSSLSAYLLILIPKLLSALICQRAFVFVCEFLVSSDPPTVLFCRHGTAHNGLVGTFAVCGRREKSGLSEIPSSTLSRKLRSRYLVEGGLLCRSDYILINFLQWEGTYFLAWRWYWHLGFQRNLTKILILMKS